MINIQVLSENTALFQNLLRKLPNYRPSWPSNILPSREKSIRIIIRRKYPSGQHKGIYIFSTACDCDCDCGYDYDYDYDYFRICCGFYGWRLFPVTTVYVFGEGESVTPLGLDTNPSQFRNRNWYSLKQLTVDRNKSSKMPCSRTQLTTFELRVRHGNLTTRLKVVSMSTFSFFI